jgi:hypothetical protein
LILVKIDQRFFTASDTLHGKIIEKSSVNGVSFIIIL